jgi:hypothetical protein
MSHPPIACTLSAHEMGCGAADLLPGLVPIAESVRAIPEGVRFEFAAQQELVPRIAAVMERERQCCQFMRFRLELSPGLGPIVLIIDGPPGTSDFLARLHPAFARGVE